MRCFLIIFLVCLFSCAHRPQRDWTSIQNPLDRNTNPELILSSQLLHEDQEQLLYALTHVYSGSRFLPQGEMARLKRTIQKLQSPMSAQELCRQLAQAFDEVSDNHLKANFMGESCLEKTKLQISRGENFYEEKDDIPWHVESRRVHGKKVVLISITSFPQNNSPKWNGFLEKVREHKKGADRFVLDMRGNGGGDDTYGFRLAEELSGTKSLMTPYAPQWRPQSAKSYQVFVNLFADWESTYKREGRPIPEHVKKRRIEFEGHRDQALKGVTPPIEVSQNLNRPSIDVRVPLFILIDRRCASSCESTVDYFEYIPGVVTVGENSAGFIHFSNNGLVILKNSGVSIRLATTYNSYKDGRFLEKVGITPKIQVPAGEDALGYALKYPYY